MIAHNFTSDATCARPIAISDSSLQLLPFPPPEHYLEIRAHNQQRTLQTARNKIDAPSTPTLHAKPLSQTTSPHEAARSLNAHHRNAETADALEVPRRPYLREVLDRRKDCAEDPEEVGPPLRVLRAQVHVVDGQDQDYDCMRNGQERYEEGGLV